MEISWLKNKIILCGPYVGDMNVEIIIFRPFVYWLQSALDTNNIVISTHYNRSFLYNFTNYPIFKQYTKDEEGQQHHKHKKINSKDYGFLINEIKDNISKQLNCNKNNIINYNLGYASLPKIFNIQRIHYPITQYNTSSNSNITFIPDQSRTYKELNKVFYHINKYNNVELIGDKKIKLQAFNHLFSIENYYQYIYEFIIGKILSSKLVICPTSHWTYICNLHNVPVFSWGKNVGIYKDTYNFGNTKSRILPFNRKSNINILFKGIDKIMEELC